MLAHRISRTLAAVLFLVIAGPVAASSNNTLTTVQPVEVNGPLLNPYAGWGIWVGPRDWEFKNFSIADDTTAYPDDAPLFSWVMVDWNWSDIEKNEGQYNWQEFDRVLQYWSARGKHFVVRFWVTDDAGWNGDPGTNPIPEWLWKKGLRYRDYKGNGGAPKREPDYLNPTYQSIYLPALKRLLNQFAAKYDKPQTDIEFLQVMGYGHWADFATWYSHYPFPTHKSQHDLLAQIMQLYIGTFHNIQLFEFAGTDWNKDEFKSLDDQIYIKANDVALANNFGLIWTGFIDGVGAWDRALMNQEWKRHPIIAEDNWDYLEIKDQGTHGTLDENLDLMLEYHANLGHYYIRSTTYARAMKEDRANFERGVSEGGFGYRLVPRTVSWRSELPAGDLLAVKQQWVNRNVGNLSVLHFLKIYLTDPQGQEKFSEMDRSFDPRPWVQGQEYAQTSIFHLPKDLPPGEYDVRIALADPQGEPRIHIPIAGGDKEIRYPLGKIHILPARKQTACDTAFCK